MTLYRVNEDRTVSRVDDATPAVGRWPSPGVSVCECGFGALDFPSWEAHRRRRHADEPLPPPLAALLVALLGADN